MAKANTVPRVKAELPKHDQRVISYSEAGVEALQEEMRRNENIFYIGQGVGPRGGNFRQSRGLWEEFGRTEYGIRPSRSVPRSG